MAAHDIKNPLSSIKLTSQALKVRHEKAKDEACLKLVNLNINAADNLLELVNEMLAYSKDPSLLLKRKQDFELNGLIAKILSLLVVPDKVEIVLPAGKHQLCFSLIALEQILINLISNAIRYNDKPSGRITISFSETEDFYMVEVEDNGSGIPAAYHEKIFENNMTLNIKDWFNTKGSGIGLATVKDLLNVLKSRVQIKSIVGEGTSFMLYLKK